MSWKKNLIAKYRENIGLGPIRVRTDLIEGTYISKKQGSEYCNEEMAALAGQMVNVISINDNSTSRPRIVVEELSEYVWTDCMFEDYKHLQSSFEPEISYDDEDDDDELED